MRQLQTIQTKENLNELYAMGSIGSGGANHHYLIASVIAGKVVKEKYITFQKGARKEEGSIVGVIDTDLLEIVRDRMIGFQSGEFANPETSEALFYVEQALQILNYRVEDRIKRNVLGTNNK